MKNAICMILMFVLGSVGGYLSGCRNTAKKVEYIPVKVTEFVENNQPNEEPEAEEVEENQPKEEFVSIGMFKATGYCPCVKCCGKTPDNPLYGITASETKAIPERTIAVDPNVIPLGTEIYLSGNKYGSGDKYVAEDTGSAIKGRRIDIFYDSHDEALNFGVQDIELFVKNETE